MQNQWRCDTGRDPFKATTNWHQINGISADICRDQDKTIAFWRYLIAGFCCYASLNNGQLVCRNCQRHVLILPCAEINRCSVADILSTDRRRCSSRTCCRSCLGMHSRNRARTADLFRRLCCCRWGICYSDCRRGGRVLFFRFYCCSWLLFRRCDSDCFCVSSGICLMLIKSSTGSPTEGQNRCCQQKPLFHVIHSQPDILSSTGPFSYYL